MKRGGGQAAIDKAKIKKQEACQVSHVSFKIDLNSDGAPFVSKTKQYFNSQTLQLAT